MSTRAVATLAPAAGAPTASGARTGGLGGAVALALASVYLIWGSTYLVMRIAVHTVPPMLMGAVRFSIAGAILLALGARRAGRLPSAREWLAAAPIGVLLFVGGNGLVAYAETSLSSGVAAVVVATMPLWMAVVGSLLGERPQRREWAGIAIGVAGVAVLMSGGELSGDPRMALVLSLSPISWALGSTLARRVTLAPGLLSAATQQVWGGAAMLAVGLARGERWPASVGVDATLALAYLTVFGSLIAFSAYAWLLRNTRPAVATSYAFVNPPLAVLLGVVLGSEGIDHATLLGTPIIVAAVVLVVGRPRPKA